MNNYSLILAEILFTSALICFGGFDFLMILESMKHRSTYRGLSSIVLSLFISILMITVPLTILLVGYTPTEVDPIRRWIIDYPLWPSIIVINITSALVLGVVTVTVRPIEDEFLNDD